MRTARALLAPEVIQTSAMDCGPAVLKSLLEGSGVPVSYGRLRDACQTDVDGTSIDTLEDLARELGLDAEQLLLPADHLLAPGSDVLPAIAVVRLPNGFTHFVLVWRRHGPFVQVMDPAGGRRWMRARRLVEDLHVHEMSVPAESFVDFASSAPFARALHHRLRRVGVGESRARALGEEARRGEDWRGLAALDAAARLVSELVEASVLRTGRRAETVLVRLFEQAKEAPDLVPPSYWTARGDDARGALRLRGAVLIRIGGVRSPRAEDTPRATDLARALRGEPVSPEAHLRRWIGADGWGAPAALGLALAVGALGTVAEALVFRGGIELATRLEGPIQRWSLGAGLLALSAALLALQLPTQALALRLGRHLETRFRRALLEKLPRLPDRYFHGRLTSDMAQRAHDVHALRRLPRLATDAGAAAFGLLATAAGLCWLVPRHAASVLAVTFVSVALPLVLQAPLAERDRRVQTHFGALTRFYLDALLGLVPLRSHGAERALRREHEGLTVQWAHAARASLRLTVGAETITSAAGAALSVGLLFAYLAGGGPAVGSLLLVYWALRLPALSAELARATRQYPYLRNVTARLLEPLDIPEEDPAAPSAGRADGERVESPAALRFEDVSVRASGHALLRDVSAEVAPGEHVAIVGRSGAGKSTLVGLLLGWSTPAAGAVRVDGRDLGGAALTRLRSETVWVDPAVQLWNRSLLTNLRYGNAQSRAPLDAALRDAELLDAIERLPEGLSTRLGEGGARMAGGEAQRVRLGRGLMRSRPRLVLLDEAFRGLDRGARRRLSRAARARFADATLLHVSHDVADTTDFDRVWVLEDGRLVEDDAPRALLAREGSRYRHLVETDRRLRRALFDGELRRMRMVDGRVRVDRADPEEEA
ncbi:MAG TPA: ATP-binding cassette domain-containing protein [Sandaracinaceae bacterium LLY-WYZ-13_1]|nr:ATP-binding cassette domain-containing protein [Sandaracinaceae bacterium LLY-WYZ-13_1]